MKTIDRALLGCGILIPLWLFLGVALTARAYPGYSHLDQAMSQLGAAGAPTHSFSAWVNNFPLGVMFVLFATGVARRFKASPMALLSAALISSMVWQASRPAIFPVTKVVRRFNHRSRSKATILRGW